MDEAAFMDLANCGEHLHQDMDCDLEAIVLLKTAANFSQINCHQIHHNQILLRIMHEVINIGHMLQPYTINVNYQKIYL